MAGTKHWVTNRLKDLVTGKYIETYNNTAGQIFQSGTGYDFPLEVFPDEPNSSDCTVIYSSALLVTPHTKNDCTTHKHGSVVNYTVPAGKYTSTVSQANADSLAASDDTINGQDYANANGTCIADTIYYNVRASAVYTKNDCGSGTSGTAVEYVVPANTYSSYVGQTDADNQAQTDITTNGQTYANAHGTCVTTTLIGTLLVDYYPDYNADVCFYCHTAGTAENDIPVTAPESNLGTGVRMYPNDGRDPATSYLLASNYLTIGSVHMRFGINMTYFISQYPAIDHFTFILRGRTTSSLASSGVYALRDVSQGHLILSETSPGSGKYIPGVSGVASPTVTSYSSHTTSGGDGTTGISVGSPILQLDYVVSTNTLTKTTY